MLWCALPAAIGWQPTTVLTNSMRPRIDAGDIAVVRPVAAESLHLGQIILYDDPDRPGRLRLHRLVGVDSSGRLITRGDANPVDDSTPAPAGSVRGVGTLRIPYVGLPRVWWQEHRRWRIGLLAATVLVVALTTQLDHTLRAPNGRRDWPRRRGAGPSADADASGASGRVSRRRTGSRTALLRVLAGTVAGCTAAFGWVGGARSAYGQTTSNASDSWSSVAFYKCANAILGDTPGIYYKLDETGGVNVTDSSANARNGRYRGTVTLGVTSACVRDGGTAVTLDGSTGYLGYATTLSVTGSYTLELWFKTTSTSGGRLLGFGSSATGASLAVDRQLYLTNAGKVVYGINPVLYKTVTSPSSYNDGAWHHVMATQSAAGMKLYVDGTLVGSDPATTTSSSYSGYLRAGYDNLLGWPSAPTSYFLAGSVDEVAWYDHILTATNAAQHYDAGI